MSPLKPMAVRLNSIDSLKALALNLTLLTLFIRA